MELILVNYIRIDLASPLESPIVLRIRRRFTGIISQMVFCGFMILRMKVRLFAGSLFRVLRPYGLVRRRI